MIYESISLCILFFRTQIIPEKEAIVASAEKPLIRQRVSEVPDEDSDSDDLEKSIEENEGNAKGKGKALETIDDESETESESGSGDGEEVNDDSENVSGSESGSGEESEDEAKKDAVKDVAEDDDMDEDEDKGKEVGQGKVDRKGADEDVEMEEADKAVTDSKTPVAENISAGHISKAAMANTIEETPPEGEWCDLKRD